MIVIGTIKYILLLLLLINVTYTDIKRLEIDHLPLGIAFGAGIALQIIGSLTGQADLSWKNSLYGFIFAAIFSLILGFLGMGGGDMKLFPVLGLYIGLFKTLWVFYISAIVGIIYALICIKYTKRSFKDPIPYAPAISLAVLIVLLGWPWLSRLSSSIRILQRFLQ